MTMTIGSLADWADVVATTLVALVSYWLGSNMKQKFRLELAKSRLEKYEKLWAELKVARPSRERFDGEGPIRAEERKKLHDALVDWYFTGGGGVMLDDTTRSIFLTAKDNLVCPVSDLQPSALAESLGGDESERDKKRGSMSMRQLSLLRTSMKSDLEIFGRSYYSKLSDEDKLFLDYCGADLNRAPWNGADGRSVSNE